MPKRPREVQRAFDHLSRSRSEMRKAVERFAEVDALEGHRAEAVRLARALKNTADWAVTELSHGS